MNKKVSSQVIMNNSWILAFSIITTVDFMRDVNQALYTPKDMDTLNVNNAGYTLLSLKIDVIQGGFHNLYTIYNYPLIPILGGIMYNIYTLVKIHRSKDNL